MKRGKIRKTGWILFGMGIFCFYYAFYQYLFEELNANVILLGVAFLLFAGTAGALESDKEIAVVLVVIGIVIASWSFGVTIRDWHHERMIEEMFKPPEKQPDETLWALAVSAHENYSKDTRMMSAFGNLSMIRPYLKEQTLKLSTSMHWLEEDMTIKNYNISLNLYNLCFAMNADYEENASFYFAVYGEKYSDMDYVREEFHWKWWDDVLHRKDKLDFTDGLDDIGSQLQYIGNILEMRT